VDGAAAATRIVDAFRAPGCNFVQAGGHHILSPDDVVDISHESLIRQWAKLSEWLQAESLAAANWRRLMTNAERHAAGEGELVKGLDLASLERWWDIDKPSSAWAARHGGRYDDAKAFLARSAAARQETDRADERRRVSARRQMFVIWALTFVVVPCLSVMGIAFWQAQSSRQAYLRAVAQAKLVQHQSAQNQIIAEERLAKLNQMIAAARQAITDSRNEQISAQISEQNALSAVKMAQDKLINAQREVEGIRKKDPQASDFLDIASKALTVCEKMASDPACRAIVGADIRAAPR
jgi:hypothetical protein